MRCIEISFRINIKMDISLILVLTVNQTQDKTSSYLIAVLFSELGSG